MSFLSCARGDGVVLDVVGVRGERRIRKGYGHLGVLGRGSQGGMVMVPEDERIDGGVEFIGEKGLGGDGGGR